MVRPHDDERVVAPPERIELGEDLRHASSTINWRLVTRSRGEVVGRRAPRAVPRHLSLVSARPSSVEDLPLLWRRWRWR